jgi:hypothetical protein
LLLFFMHLLWGLGITNNNFLILWFSFSIMIGYEWKFVKEIKN